MKPRKPLRVRRKRPTEARPSGDCPTAETLSKHVPDAIMGLPGAVEGFPKELQQAAIAIDRAYCRLTAKLMSRAAPFQAAIRGKETEHSRGDIILILKYQEWMRQSVKRGLHTESLIDMIIDGTRPELCDQRYRRRAGTSHGLLVAGLKLYLQVEIPADAKGRGLEARLAQTGDNRPSGGTKCA